MNKFYLGILLGLAAAVGWSFNGVVAKFASGIGPFGIALSRDLIVFSFFVSVAVLRGKSGHLKKAWRHKRQFAVMGVLFSINSIFAFAAYKQTFISSAAAINFTFPMIIVLLSPFLIKEKTTPKELAGVALSVTGVMVIFQSTSSVFADLAGNVFSLCAAMAFALYSIAMRNIKDRPPLEVLLAFTFGFSAITVIAAGTIFGQPFFTGATQADFLSMIWLGLVSGIMGHGSYSLALKYVKPHVASTMTLATPIIASVLAFVILLEIPPALTLLGVTISLTGIFITIRMKSEALDEAAR